MSKGGLSFTRFRVGYKVLERATFPADKGTEFRRGLLTDLREASCQQAPGLCPIAPGPLPFVYTPPADARTRLLAGDALMGSLILVGQTAAHAPCYIEALDRKARRGLGPERCRVILEQVDWLDPRNRLWTQFYFSREEQIRSTPVAFTAELLEERAALLRGRRRITLQFVTPLRLPRLNALAEDLLTTLFRRVDDAARRWCGAHPASRPPLDGVELVADEMTWRDRPGRTPEGQGRITLGGDLDPWFGLLVAGQQLHLGHGAALGFGAYELRP